MAIRCAAKALVVRDGRLLLNRCRKSDGSVYYDLPGGGQHLFESMEEAVRREVREETGMGVRILRFAALAEEIYTNESLRQKYPDYAHRMMHIFLAEPDGTQDALPTEKGLGYGGKRMGAGERGCEAARGTSDGDSEPHRGDY